MVESKGSASSQLPGVPVRLYRAVLTHTDIQITVRIWSTTDHDWTWTPLDTWTPDPTLTTPAQLADELHRHGWTTPEDPTTLTKVTVIPENWQALVEHALAARNQQADQLRVADRQVHIYVENLIGEAEEVYRIASRSYEEGEASYLEVLEAQRILRTTRTEYTQALFEYEAALADMEQAVGGALIPVNR